MQDRDGVLEVVVGEFDSDEHKSEFKREVFGSGVERPFDQGVQREDGEDCGKHK